MEAIYAGSGMHMEVSDDANTKSISFVLEAMRELFDTHFDNGWFLNILDKFSFNRSALRDIRTMIHLTTITEADLPRLEAGVEALEEFLVFSSRYVRPVLRDELGISGFGRSGSDSGSRDRFRSVDQTSAVLKGFFLYTFPHNLDKMADLYGQLESLVGSMRDNDGSGSTTSPERAVQ